MKRPLVIALLATAMVLVCLGIGAVLFFTANGGFPTNNPFDRRNIPSALEETETFNVDSEEPVSLRVATAAGDVTITGADVDTVQVRVVRTAYDSTQARADAEVKNIQYSIEQTGNAITLRYELPRSMNFSNNINTVDFDVTVPNKVTVDVDGSTGNISVAGTTGQVDIRNDFGNITLDNIEGALSAQTSSGEVTAMSIQAGRDNIELHSNFGTVSLRNASANDITLDSSSGRIILREVRATGAIHTETDFGDTSFENGSSASLSIATSSGRVYLEKVRVREEIEVQNDFGEIELDQARSASYDLHTKSGSIVVSGSNGKLKAYTEFGGIRVEDAETVTLDLKTNSGSVQFSGSLGTGPHLVKSDFGEIDLTLPADSELNVDLSTDFGSIKSDLPITVILTGTSSSDGDQIVGSINGGGDQFTAETSSGSVTIHAGQ